MQPQFISVFWILHLISLSEVTCPIKAVSPLTVTTIPALNLQKPAREESDHSGPTPRPPGPAAASPQSPRCCSTHHQPASQCGLTWKTCDAMSSLTWPAARTLAVNLVLPPSISPCVFCVLRNSKANRGLCYLLKQFHVRHAGVDMVRAFGLNKQSCRGSSMTLGICTSSPSGRRPF